MSVAMWTPLFVTADVPVEVINKVLQSAQQEAEHLQHLGEGFYNGWVVIQDPSQQNISKPTKSVALDFRSGFLEYSLDQVEDFVDGRLGEGALGQGDNPLDHLSADCFGIIDERTVKDNTILLLVQDLVNDIEEAEIRVAWGTATEHDKAITRCAWDEATENDLRLLAHTIGIDLSSDEDQTKDKIAEYLEKRREDTEVLKWFEIRLDAGYSISGTGGLYLLGAVETLMRRDDFDEDGVMRGIPLQS